MKDLQKIAYPVFGWNRSALPEETTGGYDISHDLHATLERAEQAQAVIVIAVPMPALPSMLDAIHSYAPSCGFTDVTSVKTPVLDLVAERGMQDRFVGGHPMAGTAESGWQATMTGLFQGATWVLTYDNAPITEEENSFWCQLWAQVAHIAGIVGAHVVPAGSQRHDAAVARISHLPHILAETLSIVGDEGGALALSLAASSFRDGTRVAGTQPSLVRAMCENNREALVEALDSTIDLLRMAREQLADPEGDIDSLVSTGYAARLRYELSKNRGLPIIQVYPGGVPTDLAHSEAVENKGLEEDKGIEAEPQNWLEQLRYAESIGASVEVRKYN